MSRFPIKIRKTDTLFSQYIRKRDGWRCQRCQRLCKISGEDIYRLEASHYISRRNEAVRFDSDNVTSLCVSCHERMGGYKPKLNGEYDEFKKHQLGEKRFKELLVKAFRTFKKRDDRLDLMIIKELIKIEKL